MLLEFAYKFTLFLRDINKRTKNSSWNKGRSASAIRTEIIDLVVDVNKYLPYLEPKQKLNLQNKVTDMQNYIADFLTGTDEAITSMMSRMNKVDAELQEITKDLKGLYTTDLHYVRPFNITLRQQYISSLTVRYTSGWLCRF